MLNIEFFNFFIIPVEYDDGDDESHETYSYNSSLPHNSAQNKRRYDNGSSSNDLDGTANDDTEDTRDGESSTSSSSENLPKKKRRKEFLNLNATFMAGVQGVQLVTDQVNVKSKSINRHLHSQSVHKLNDNCFTCV